MPRGQPDYGLYQPQFAIAGLADLGEAVARLGSINVYDRRGFTVWQDDFEAPSLKWTPTQGGLGALPVLSTVASYSGIQSVFLDSVGLAGSGSRISRTFPLIRRGKIGIEFWVQGLSGANSYIELALRVYDGASPNFAHIRYQTANRTVEIFTPLGWQVIDTRAYMQTTDFHFLPIKLVIDMDADTYTRLLVGRSEYDIRAHQLVVMAPSTNEYIEVQFTANQIGVPSVWFYLDNFILTQNEP